MAWRDVDPMDERIRFVLRATHEEVSFAGLCRQFGISRKTGYKWVGRYRRYGLGGVHELSRRPLRSPKRTAEWIEKLIVRERGRRRTWGPRKLRHQLLKTYPMEVVPAESTIARILDRHGLTRKRRRRAKVVQPDRHGYTEATRPNEVWAADFKGWFRTTDGQRCDPLTMSDLFSRYLLECRQVGGQTIQRVRPVFRRVFIRYGLPEVLRVDNGSPFGSRGVRGLTRLSAWWLRLGIRVEFIEPGHPEQNGVHERMHRTLKAETARPPAATLRTQQRRFDRWRRDFNHERPHEAIGMQTPSQRYERSPRRYTEHPKPPTYPPHYSVRKVRSNGQIKWRGILHYVGEALYGMALGLSAVAEDEHAVYFGDLLLGYLHEQDTGGLRPTPATPAPSPHQTTQV
jgi:putative transposase